MVFNSCQMVYLLHSKISVFTHDFQQKTRNWLTKFSSKRVENHVEEIKKNMMIEMKHQIDADQYLARGEYQSLH